MTKKSHSTWMQKYDPIKEYVQKKKRNEYILYY